MIRVIADTTCDFPQELQEKYGLERMSLTITMNGKSYEDGGIGAEEVYSAMRRGIVPRTAQISYSVLYRTFERICRAGMISFILRFRLRCPAAFPLRRPLRTSCRRNIRSAGSKWWIPEQAPAAAA